MKKSSRKFLLETENGDLLVKGLLSPSILEPAVPLKIRKEDAGSFQGIEIYEISPGLSKRPQVVADLISNTYFRLSHHLADGSSATFGTSLVGSFSYKSDGKLLKLIPVVDTAELSLMGNNQVQVEVLGSYGGSARILSKRTYSKFQKLHERIMHSSISFTAQEDIYLDPMRRKNDCFRLITISSMFSSRECFDANYIRFNSGEEAKSISIAGLEGRNRYVFDKPHICQEFELIKTQESLGKRNSPGSPDSPSVSVKLLNSSLGEKELGVQAYLAESISPDDDSLSVWLEWIQCPSIIKAGTRIEAEFEIKVSAPSAA